MDVNTERDCFPINLLFLNDDLSNGEIRLSKQNQKYDLTLQVSGEVGETELTVKDSDGVCVSKFSVGGETECCKVGTQSFLVTPGYFSVLLHFRTQIDFQTFQNLLKRGIGHKMSAFNQRTDDSSALQYFQFYGCLSQQQNMLQDYLRTGTYQKAILMNEVDFKGKTVLDVGCGSGILSFFAVQAGAKKVYAVEASSAAKYAQALANGAHTEPSAKNHQMPVFRLHAEEKANAGVRSIKKILVQSNNLCDKITVVVGKIEEVSFPEDVDVIISEPIGYMLLNERMLESYLHSRKWLKPNGKMFPTSSDIHLAPFTDELLYMEHYARSSFWHQTCFHGINLSSLHSASSDEFFKQPIVDTFDMQILMAKSVKYSINFLEAKEEDLHKMEIPFVFHLLQSGLIHGLAIWFDVAFVGSSVAIDVTERTPDPLVSGPMPASDPLFAKVGQTLSGKVLLVANRRQSYDIHITAVVDQSGFKSGNSLDLKNPFFRYA